MVSVHPAQNGLGDSVAAEGELRVELRSAPTANGIREAQTHIAEKAHGRCAPDKINKVPQHLRDLGRDVVIVVRGADLGHNSEANGDATRDKVANVLGEKSKTSGLREVEHEDDVVEVAPDEIHLAGVDGTEHLWTMVD